MHVECFTNVGRTIPAHISVHEHTLNAWSKLAPFGTLGLSIELNSCVSVLKNLGAWEDWGAGQGTSNYTLVNMHTNYNKYRALGGDREECP